MSTQIRRATTDDLPQLKTIIDASFRRFFRYFAWQSVSDMGEPTLVYVVEGMVAGFAKLIEFNVKGLRYGCILWIATDPAFRRKGVALTLTQAGLEHFRTDGVEAVFASTQRHNMGALATLGRMGFVRVGFSGLWRRFGWGVFGFFGAIWYAPSEVVLVRDLYFGC